MTLSRLFSIRTALKIGIGLPLTAFVFITLLQLPRLWGALNGNPDRLSLAAIQGGLPVLPFILFAIALWYAIDMIARATPNTALEPLLKRGLGRSGIWLIFAATALFIRNSEWAWRIVYNNSGPLPLGRSSDYLLAMVIALIGIMLIAASRRINRIYNERRALQSELEQIV